MEALSSIEHLPVMNKLDAQLTIEELSKVIDKLSSGKATDSAGIPPEMIRCVIPALLESLHELLCLCWQEGAVPQACATQSSSPCIRTRMIAVTATITGAFYCRASSERSLPTFCSQEYRHWQPASILRPSVASGPDNLPLTRSSLSA